MSRSEDALLQLPELPELSEAEVRGLFPLPVGVGVRRSEGVDDAHMPLLEGLLPSEEAALSPRAMPRRRQHFTLGRVAARAALTGLGLAPSPILRGEKGEPIWPEGIVGAITHTEGTAIAVAGSAALYAGIGVDLEPLEPGLSARAARLVCTDRELDWAAGDTVRLTMLFSAKEAIFKALYPLTRVYLHFGDAELRWLPDAASFEATLLVTAGERFPTGYTLRVGCRLVEQMVLATLSVPEPLPAHAR